MDEMNNSLKFHYRKVSCQYCDKLAVVANGSDIYGSSHKLSSKEFYYCKPCEAWVGMHSISKKPFGTLAKSDLRQKRVLAHSLFDKIWARDIEKGLSKSAARKQAYKWLADSMDMPVDKCHIGDFDIARCNQVMVLCFKKNE